MDASCLQSHPCSSLLTTRVAVASSDRALPEVMPPWCPVLPNPFPCLFVPLHVLATCAAARWAWMHESTCPASLPLFFPSQGEGVLSGAHYLHLPEVIVDWQSSCVPEVVLRRWSGSGQGGTSLLREQTTSSSTSWHHDHHIFLRRSHASVSIFCSFSEQVHAPAPCPPAPHSCGCRSHCSYR